MGIQLNLLRRRSLLIETSVQCTVFPIEKQGSKEKSQEQLENGWIIWQFLKTHPQIHPNLLTSSPEPAIIIIQQSGVGRVSPHRSFFPDAMLVI